MGGGESYFVRERSEETSNGNGLTGRSWIED